MGPGAEGNIWHWQEEEMTDTERRFRSERAGGNYSAGTKEVQEKKYIERKESDRKRRELFNDALALYKKGDLENVRLRQLSQLPHFPTFLTHSEMLQMCSLDATGCLRYLAFTLHPWMR